MEYKDNGDRRREDDEQICEHTVVGHTGNYSDVKSEGAGLRGKFLEPLTLHVLGFKPENTLAIRRQQGKDACSADTATQR